MKRAWVLMIGLAVMAAVVGCGEDNPAGPGAGALVGTWKVMKAGGEDYPYTSLLTFTKDGKYEGSTTVGGQTLKGAGAYKVEGDKITANGSFMGEDGKWTFTFSIKGSTLTLKDEEDGSVMELQKV